jgi:hypothetical protein
MASPWCCVRSDGTKPALTEEMESRMKSMKTYLIVWLSGLIAGLILMERWQRTSGLQVPAPENAGEAVQTDAVTKLSAGQPRVSAVVVAGAKADAERARQFLGRVTPFGRTSAPSVAELSRSGQAAVPGTTPNDPT